MYSGMARGTSQAEAMEKIKPVYSLSHGLVVLV